MDYLLAWENLIFLVPLLLGLCAAAGLAFGAADSDQDHDASADAGHDAAADHDLEADRDVGAEGESGGDHDADADHDAEADQGSAHGSGGSSAVHGLLSLLGVGKVPLTTLVMTLLLLFGATGLASNAVLRPVLPFSPGILSLLVAAAVAAVATRSFAGLVARVAPMTESQNVRRRDLVGCSGHALFDADGASGFVQLRDREGNVQQVRCRTLGQKAAKGTTLVLVEYVSEGDYYLVEPVAEGDKPALPATRDRALRD